MLDNERKSVFNVIIKNAKAFTHPQQTKTQRGRKNDVKRKRSGAFLIGEAFLDLSSGQGEQDTVPHFAEQ